MDWLEISWDELRIKERIGAGSFETMYCAEWHGLQVTSTINTLAGALYKVFCASPDPASIEMHRACFNYLSLGGVCSYGPIALLSSLNPRPLSLVLHFFVVAVYGVGRLLIPFPSPKRMYKALIIWFKNIWLIKF
ncbi:putative squalene monooxygenase [Medicago truncatula]|nr:putative squalene monooxygenase [Medicago truncatula]